MDISIYLDAVALLIIGVIALFHYEPRRSKVHRYQMFNLCLVLTAGTLISDMVSLITIGDVSRYPLWVNILVNSIYFIFINSCLSIVAAYVFYLLFEYMPEQKCYKIASKLILSMWIILTLLVFVNLKTGCYFYFENNAYCRGPLNKLGFIVMGVEVCMLCACYFRNRKVVTPYALNLVKAIPPVVMMLTVLQFLFPTIVLTGIIAALVNLILFICFQSNRVGRDALTELPNRNYFWSDLHRYEEKSKNAHMILIHIRDMKKVNKHFGMKNGDKFLFNIARYLEKQVITRENPETTPVLREVIADAYDRLIAPAIEREIRSDLTEKAEDGAIKVFGKNLEQLLMQPPIAGQVVLGWDPAFRTGCKLAVVDPTGKVLDTTVIYPTPPFKNKADEEKKIADAKLVLKKLISKYKITLISLGNGTASRESEQIIVDLLKEIPVKVQYIIVNEAGASVYSASKLATEEFPNFDVGQRSATSMARRLQDPLAELVKIDPKSIGVGQYQHDMNQKKLSETLGGVVEDCVNKVGVDLNTASASLLEYISGISKTVAKNIVAYREENGQFASRNQLLKVAKLGPKAYEQCAGFMRINDGKHPLDATGVHPESYEATIKLLEKLGYTLDDVKERNLDGISKKIFDYKKLAEELGIGDITLQDIVKELEKPARDPREDMPKPILRSDVLAIEDLTPGMILKGTVRNVIDFGAFVDIGVHQDGLVHISQICDKFIKHPLEVVSVGDIVEVKVMSVDVKKQRIQLTMKLNG